MRIKVTFDTKFVSNLQSDTIEC